MSNEEVMMRLCDGLDLLLGRQEHTGLGMRERRLVKTNLVQIVEGALLGL